MADEELAIMLTYHIDLSPDPSGEYTATIREFPGCVSEGETLQEATASILSVAQEWLEIAIGRELDPLSEFAKKTAADRRAFLEADLATVELMLADRAGEPSFGRHGMEQWRLAILREMEVK